MKWIMLIGSTILITGCAHDTIVYKQVSVLPQDSIAVYTYPQKALDVTKTTISYY